MHLGMNTNKKKKSWRGTHTGEPIRTRKRKAGGGLHRGTYKNKKKKSRRGLTQEDLKKPRKRKAGGGPTLGNL